MRQRLLGLAMILFGLSVGHAWSQARGATMFGSILFEDGSPVADVSLTLSNAQGSRTITSGRLGQYILHNVKPGRYAVSLGSELYHIVEPLSVLVAEEGHRVNVIVSPAQGTLVPAESAEGSLLSGRLTTADGKPIPGIVVVAASLSTRTDHVARETVSDENGAYRFEGLPAGAYEIQIGGESFVLNSRAVVRVVSGEDTQWNLTLGLLEQVEVAALAPESRVSAANPGMSTRLVEAVEIEKRKASSLIELLRIFPGMSINREGGVGQRSEAYIRGGAANYALVLIDGLPANDPGGAFDFGKLLPLEIGSIEVTRGAASSIYGGALSGVVHMTTRSADQGDANAYVDGQFGSFGWDRVQAGTSGRNDVFDWNVGVLRLQTDNQQPNSAFTQFGGAASLGVRFSEETSARLVLRAESSDVGSPGPTDLIRPDLDASDEERRVVLGASIHHEAESGAEHIFRLGTTLSRKLSLNPENSGPIDIEPTEGESTEFRFVVPDFAAPDGLQNDTTRVNVAYQANTNRDNHWLSFGGGFEQQSGAFGIDSTPMPVAGGDAPPDFGAFLGRFQQQATANTPRRSNLAVFGQDQWFVRDSMILTMGARLERNGSFGTRLLPRASFAWTLGSGTTLKASAGMGVKEPSLEQSFGGNFRIQGNPDLRAEKSRTIDAGIRQSFSGDRLWAEAIVFDHQYTDQIVLGSLELPELENEFPDFSFEDRQRIREEIRSGERERFEFQVDFDQFRPSYTNLGETLGRGVELAVGSSLAWMQVRGDYTYLQSEVIEGNLFFEAGQALPKRPRHQFSLDGNAELGRLGIGGTVLFVGERLAEADFISQALGLTTEGAYTRIDLRANYRAFERWQVFAVTENLLDRIYQETLGYPALGRSVRLGVRFGWDF